MNKSTKKTTGVKRITQFEIIRPQVAGIDVSDNNGMVVAYPVSATEIAVEEFECYTRDLRLLSEKLKTYNIESVAMESTGVYWIPLFLLLQEEGFEVYLVNAKHVKNVTGRKDDEGDAEWIQKLHRCGLLSASFQPDNHTRTLRSIVRHRDSLVKTRSTYLNRMQKALEQMNLKIHTVISDIDGKTGLTIINAIISGERNPEKLADLRDGRIKAPREEIVKSLEGFWSEEHIFELSQCYSLYKFHNEMIRECDLKIEKHLQETIKSKNNGVIYSETGDNWNRFKNEKHFTSWLGLAPNTKKSGGKIISSRVPKKKHYAGQAFRMAAMSLSGNKGPLGDYYRRIRSIAGTSKAIVALARKLAVIYYQMITTKEKYDPQKLIDYQKKYREQKIKNLEKYLNRLKAVA